MPEVELIPELRDVVVRIDVVPGCRLVHLDVGDSGALVLTIEQARAIASELQRTARRAASRPDRRQPLMRRRGGSRGDARG